MRDNAPSSEQEEANGRSGAQLRALRQSAGLSQEELSLAANVDQSTLSKVERLGPQVISWQKLFSIADAIDCVVEVSFRRKNNESG
jgi:transcriptional regulator with XRE-family HTH domain